jgi:hypothetical protein
VSAAVFTLALAARARAAEPRPQLPESMLTESATDVDATTGGEVEWELNAAALGALRGGAGARNLSLEVEWRVLAPVGVRVEPFFEQTREGTARTRRAGMAGALALALFHDPERDAHVQLELLAHTKNDARDFDPSDTVLPAAADVVSAVRLGRITLRGTAGAEAFGAFAHAPLHTDAALLTGFLPNVRAGFMALDVRADFARRAPLVVAPELVADGSPLGVPFRFGAALPVNVGARATDTAFGVMFRLTLISESERAFVGAP